MTLIASDKVISTILKHDTKVTSYKIALLRAINDVVLTYPDLRTYHSDVAVPLKLLAEFWIAYYWPFVDPDDPIQQGQRAQRQGQTTNDMAFRPALTELRRQWELVIGGLKNPADGFFLINELRSPRKHQRYPQVLIDAYQQAIAAVAKTIEMPIRYAGPGEWSIFDKPQAYNQVASRTVAVPGTKVRDRCLVIPLNLWSTFRQMSLWVEALCIHEWCLFSGRVSDRDRGYIYALLTSRPDNRRPLTWERNQIDILIMEGTAFTCPWTEKRIAQGTAYDLDHILPIAVYPTNELWNLVPADPDFNSHKKRDRLPTAERLVVATPHLEHTYLSYGDSKPLIEVLREDVALRFATVATEAFSESLALAVAGLVEEIAESRNLARF
ncbi:HNH endonuclease domain-containing protein [Nodosilinea sp. AN01ver1]|uniref:HNH endonuclease domain-containing protein n=1 Tax=Nodosilinea sp. AN01ver1 TaxID=3423362 RepID=UPI003D31B1E4